MLENTREFAQTASIDGALRGEVGEGLVCRPVQACDPFAPTTVFFFCFFLKVQALFRAIAMLVLYLFPG